MEYVKQVLFSLGNRDRTKLEAFDSSFWFDFLFILIFKLK
jgi:hypothetical protein